MNYRSIAATLFGACAILWSSPAFTADDGGAAVEFLPLSIEDGALNGDGADMLREKLANAQFILIGEDHGFADAPIFSLALAKAARDYGVTNHVVEIGPLTDRWVTGILNEKGVDGLAAALEGRPSAIPFLSLREDAELANYFLKEAARRQDALWGIDQEFVGAPLILLEELAASTCTDSARARAEALLKKEQSAFAAGDQSSIFLFATNDDAFAELHEAFSNCRNAAPIISGLQESAKIYQLFQIDGYMSNARRVAFIRQQFLEQYRASRKKAPRALIKLGAYHVGLGTTPVNTFDIGSLTEGIAASNGLDVLRIAFFPLDGQKTSISLAPGIPYGTEDFHSEDIENLLQQIGAASDDVSEAGWTLISTADIRAALGGKGIAGLSEDMRFIVLGFDYLVTTRNAKAATPLAE